MRVEEQRTRIGGKIEVEPVRQLRSQLGVGGRQGDFSYGHYYRTCTRTYVRTLAGGKSKPNLGSATCVPQEEREEEEEC